MNFYVDIILDDSLVDHAPDQRLIGLFKGGYMKGEGYFCGWYASEYRCCTQLIATQLIDTFDSEDILKGSTLEFDADINKLYSKIQVQGIYSQRKVHAVTKKDAIIKFLNQNY